MKKQKFPPGWDEERVKAVIAHYDNQTDEEALGEIDAARQAENITLMAVPTALAPQVRALLVRKRKHLGNAKPRRKKPRRGVVAKPSE